MFRVAIKMLLGESAKYVTLVSSLAVVSFLFLQQGSIFCGLMLRTARPIEIVGAPIWVCDPQLRSVDENKPLLDTDLQRVRSAAGTQYRVLHTLQTTEFRVPMGFNTPVSADHWLSCGPLEIRRSILAVLASLILDTQTCSTLMSHCGRGRTFWKAMKLLHCSEDRQAFKYRAASWSPDLIDAVDFY